MTQELQTRFVMLGGFLGAGKTTTIARLARHFQDQGLQVGIVTNDQAADLVDTHTLRSQGFEVGEVAGACFCCHFDELTAVAAELGEQQRPDVVLAEPVGSCTDLVATVIQPLHQLFESRFDVAPYGVLLKPSHGRRILKNQPRSGFSPQAAYIFRKQLEEADFVVINRIDQLTRREVDELEELIRAQYPAVPLIRMSARTGEGFEEFVQLIGQRGDFGRRVLDLDYDIYAAGEAELGWLNARLQLTAERAFELDRLLVDLVEQLSSRLAAVRGEAAHLKTIGSWKSHHGVANLVSSDTPVELSLASGCCTRRADLIINARAAVDPQLLQELVEATVASICAPLGATAEHQQLQSFRPGRPTPTHRMTV